jgi:hypothetical protein
LSLVDANLASLGTANVDTAVLCPRDAIGAMQARNGDPAPAVDMTVPY